MEAIGKDVVVVGLGAFGSAALWRLADRGAKVAGIERHGIAHHLGSSHGSTRLFRIACQEHPGLAAIALKSLELWAGLGEQAGERLLRQSGCLNVGPPVSRAVKGTLAAAAAAGMPVLELGHSELAARQPQYAGLAPDDVAVWDPGAGICYPERIIKAQAGAARRLGAEIYPHTMVTGIQASPRGVTVRTPTVDFRASQMVVAAGAWLGTLVPGLPLVPRRAPLYWFRPRDPGSEDFTLGKFPAFIWRRPDGEGLWGHGSGEDFEIDDLAARVRQAFPGLDPRPSKVIPCLITDTPDGQFTIGRPPGEHHVVVAGGDSGHGFKHAAGIGELLAQIVTGERPYCETGFLNPARFRWNASRNGVAGNPGCAG